MEYTYCVDCGKKIFEGIVFCPKCGADQTPSFSEKEIDKSPYKILQVSENAESEVIKAAYKSLSKKYHPDIDSSRNAQEKMKDINWAYSILSNSEKRKEWDISYIRRTSKTTGTQSQKSSSTYRDDPRTRYQERYNKKYSSDESWPKQSKPKKSPNPPTRQKKTVQPKYPFAGRITLSIFIIILFVAVVLTISSINSSSPASSSPASSTDSLSLPIFLARTKTAEILMSSSRFSRRVKVENQVLIDAY
jgi:curved DNA-binding protein CbpA